MVVHIDLSDDRIATSLEPYGFFPSGDTCEKIRIYVALLLRWNQRISLTALTDIAAILQIHFGESIVATSTVPIQHGRLADVGTGAGFPGIPIKIARPHLHVLLIEPNVKKCAFLSEVVRALQLDAKVIRGRMETALANDDQLDYVTSRAVGNWDGILEFGHHLKRGAELVLWVGEKAILELKTTQHGCFSWADPIKIPGAMTRSILVGKKV
jgi:16S rRNA (guanine527-N7)-methyltransferase